jgi:hypothetical protein
MTTFKFAALNGNPTGRTANGAATFVSSGNPLVDLYSAIGSSRGKNVTALFDAAYAADRKLALKILLWARDVRGGSGERETFRNLMLHLEKVAPYEAALLIPHMAFFGRWDDLLIFKTPELRQLAFIHIGAGLSDSATSGLVAKWMPRTGKVKLALCEHFGLSERNYRKMIVSLSNTVEQKMCAREWDSINFSHVPSLAASRYQKAFNRRAKDAYAAYKASLVKKDGSAKINASAVYPYDVIKSLNSGDRAVAIAQWEALPNYLGEDNILPMIDVSGSMSQGVSGTKNLTCMNVAVSLGLYVADKQSGAFKDMCLTFSTNPKIEVLTGNIGAKHDKMTHLHWEMSTNIEGAFDEILRVAKSNKVPHSEMPKILLILSDMEFNACVREPNLTNYQSAQKKFEAAGYALPRVVFWNLNARVGNSPVTATENGTALISGFSPAIMKSVLKASVKAEDNSKFTPEAVMLETLNDVRYDVIADIDETQMVIVRKNKTGEHA